MAWIYNEKLGVYESDVDLTMELAKIDLEMFKQSSKFLADFMSDKPKTSWPPRKEVKVVRAPD